MFKRIVIGIDFLPATEALLTQVADMPGAKPEAVALVYVLETRYPQTAEETHRSHYEQRLATMADELAGKLDVPVEWVVRSGEAAAELLAEVASRDADLLMIGNPRHGRVRKMLMGSTAAEVTQR
ncbi:MAG: universal stress protein, partial [Guyparkeria sp.]